MLECFDFNVFASCAVVVDDDGGNAGSSILFLEHLLLLDKCIDLFLQFLLL